MDAKGIIQNYLTSYPLIKASLRKAESVKN